MNVRWCASSDGGCSSGGISGVISVAFHDGLMAGLARQAGGAILANLDLVAVCPAVPNLVPSWFGVTPVVGANSGLCQWGGSCWCGRG